MHSGWVPKSAGSSTSEMSLEVLPDGRALFTDLNMSHLVKDPDIDLINNFNDHLKKFYEFNNESALAKERRLDLRSYSDPDVGLMGLRQFNTIEEF